MVHCVHLVDEQLDTYEDKHEEGEEEAEEAQPPVLNDKSFYFGYVTLTLFDCYF